MTIPKLNFFRTFFEFLEILILRKFYHPGYDNFLKDSLSKYDDKFKPNDFIRINPKSDLENAKNDSFFMILKENLMQKLLTTRP
mgnify:CR=1 FL=1